MRPHPRAPARGFTLIELLVVCGILAALSVTAWGTYRGVQEANEDAIARADLARLANALRRFKQDTGYYPGQGPFSLAATAQAEAECGASDGILRNWAEPTDDSARDDWFRSPANVALLLNAPTLCLKHPQAHLRRWNPDTRRGWHGPYLEAALRGWVDHGKDLNVADGSGDPMAGEKILDVPAYGNGSRFHAGGPLYERCDNQAALVGNCMFGWRSTPRSAADYDAETRELAARPRPFLMFGLADGADDNPPRVVYLGSDGKYGGRNAIDACRPNTSDIDGADDVVLCLESG
ncbi:MAG: prepilin-type N-terminal cleavage/methylation domain-containing protein [Propionivibrio sp.]